ncbi:MAG: DUF1080 domain-containing protein [Planctomycetota bacterium]|nr:DUF1080 domain-containing protein [Planctomycetota bacterium]
MRRSVTVMVLAGLTVLAMSAWLPAAEKAAAKAPAPKVVEEQDDGIQGVYLGADPASEKAGAKVVAKGGGAYKVILTTPGNAGIELAGKLDGGKVALTGPDGVGGTIAEKKLTATVGGKKYELAYAVLKAPSLGEKPPAGAIVLLPYEEGKAPPLAEWTNAEWQTSTDGSMTVAKGDNFTKRQFGDFKLHLEFRIPFEPSGKGQGRGNSGVYIFSLYEIQILDSFGLPPAASECAAVYTQTPPKVNACFPPGLWQTYDITFHAARLDADGKKTRDAVVTVVQNGVTVQDQTVVKGPTGAARSKPEVKAGQIKLQDHQHPVKFRNIWIQELKD